MGWHFSIVLLLVFVGRCYCQDAVRLVGGNGPREGRVEVLIAGEWGTICDDLWDINDGHVICRQLGYSGADTIRYFAYFGEGSGRIWLDNVECTGDEETIADCPKSEFGDHNCQHYEDAGVECSMQKEESVTEETIEDIRLVGGSSANVGRLEVLVHGRWGTVCDDDWDINDATVVCRQLGYPGADSAEGFAFFGQGSDPIWLDNVRCSGEEGNLKDCPKNDIGEHNCNHYEDAGVRCTRAETVAPTDVTAPPGIEDIRLVGGTSEKEGRLEVYVNGEWGTVCDDFWDQPDADVVCRQLGFIGSYRIRTSESFGEGEGRIWLDDVLCTGREESLQDCPKNDIGDENCGHSEDVGVECIPLNDSISTAAVTQRWRDDFQCGGSFLAPNGEIAECNPHGPNPCCSPFGWCDVTPSHCECFDCVDYRLTGSMIIQDIRLADGRTVNMGRVEVLVNGIWGAVCDDLWDMNDATVTCKQLGFPGAETARQNSYFGTGPDFIWLDNVECVGDETTLADCPKNDIGDENCGGSEHAGVVCHPQDTPLESAVYLIYSEAASIQLIGLSENHKDPVPPLTDFFNVVSIAPVYSKTGILFSDVYNGSILYRPLKESNTVTILEGVGSVEGLAYNQITEEIFWTSYTNSSISRMKVFPRSTAEEEKEEILVRMSASDHPRGIALDVCNSAMFWTNWNNLNPSIMTASMAGRDVRAIITTEIQVPNGIIIDAFASKLYWCDARLDKIERANLDGTNRVVITETEIAHPFDLAIYENNLYWTDWVHRDVRRVNKFTGENMVVVRSELSRSPMGITVLEEPLNCSALPCAKNNGGCEELCDTDEYGAVKCSCMEGKRLADDNRSCVTYYQDIRLTGGQSENEGRVEVLVKGEWGTVCDDLWDLDDAMVVCKELGYTGAEASFILAHFGEGTGAIWLDNVHCSGDENSLNDCMKNSIGDHDCSHSEDAGVTCTEKSDAYLIYSEVSSIQMISLGENQEDPIPLLTNEVNVIAIAPVFSKRGIFYSDVYKGAIFYHSLSENNTVTIIEGVGSVEGIAYNHVTDEIFWTGYTNSTISRMKVFPHSPNGDELLLSISASDHPRGIVLDICTSSIFWTNWNEHDPSIMTASMTGEDYRAVIRTDIVLPNGIVIDSYASKLYWCDARLDKVERANLDGTNRVVIIDSYLVHLFGITIYENSLYLTDWGRDEVIRVDKYTGGNLTVLRSGLLQNPMGITVFVEPHNCSALPCATLNGGCQEICATDEYGAIQCSCSPGKYLAHDNKTCLTPSLTTSSTAQPTTTTVESTISTKGTPVIEDIRLVNGYSHNTGRVEVYVNGEWGTVCHDRWEREDAEVACRWLGYTGADAALGNAFFGEGTGPIWLDNVRCSGYEQTLRECRMRPIGDHNCGHDEDAGVECTVVPTPFGPRPGNDYRDDLRCRGGYSAPNFGQARCNRNGAYPCCSPELWCGNTPEHCECEGCVDYRDASVKDIRLRGPYPHAGKVEVFIFGEWGSVCNDYWDMEDANVACRMLGYSGADEIKRGDYYGEGYDPVLMDDVHCNGDEESLSDCPRNEPGYHDCDHRYEAASVVCTLPPSTTLPPPSTEGTTTQQRWRDDYQCGEGFLAPNGEAAECNPNGPNPCCSPHNWCDVTPSHCECEGCIDYRLVYNVHTKYRHDYRCGGNFLAPNGEVAECNPEGIYPCCSPANWCGITADHCDCTECIDYRNTGYQDIRLIGGQSENEGRVEVLVNGEWGTVCDDVWDLNDAIVVCKELGYHGADAFYTNSYFGGGSGSIWLDNVDCTGGEDSLNDCTKNAIGDHNCGHDEDAGVKCTTTPGGMSEYQDIRLIGGQSENKGRVEVLVNGEWGTVCDDIWDLNDAIVVCKELGYPGADAYFTNSYFGGGSGSIWLDNVECSGDENSLNDCTKNTIGDHNCGHDEDAGVTCSARDSTTEAMSESRTEQSSSSSSCEPLRSSLCQGMPYNLTSFPTGVTTQEEAEQLLSLTFKLVIPLGCPAGFFQFMCLQSMPPCESTGIPIIPCRELCETGVKECYEIMEASGIPIPPLDLDCSLFPTEESKLCFAQDPSGFPYEGTTTQQRWRDDYQCGEGFLAPNGEAAECNPNGPNPCCSPHNWCDVTPSHCECEGCIDYRLVYNVHTKYRHDYRCGGNFLAPNGEVAECNPEGIYPCCSPANWCGITADHCDCTECIDYRNTGYQDIRLIGGQSENEGRVEVLVNGEWGTVCDDVWDLNDAIVVCKELGYPGAESYYTNSYFGGGSGGIWLDNVDCTGDEDSLNDCTKNRIGDHNCGHDEDAGVKCTATVGRMSEYQDIRLIGGQSENKGRVEVLVNGEWGTVCDDVWDLNDAIVVCKELGYPGADAYFTNSYFGGGSGSIWLDNVECSGDENSLNDCTKNTIGDHNCGHDEDAGVTCSARDSTTEAMSESRTEQPSSSSSCEPLRSSLCQGMPYNLTSLPTGVTTQEEAEQLLSLTFKLVIPLGCPEGFFQFMCLQSMPPCESTGIPIIPCRELCETGVKECYEIMEASGIPIPPLDLDCSLFPTEESKLCFAQDPSGFPYEETETNCEEITIPLCMDQPYNLTRLPNILGQDNQLDAGLQVYALYPIAPVDCSPYIKEFLCSIYTPPCYVDMPDPPCKELCLAVKEGCIDIMTTYGFPWPESLDCDQFPSVTLGTRCYAGQIAASSADSGQDYRDDYRCGGDFLSPNGEVARCKKDGQYPCCSADKWCGITSDHCDCSGCIDYRYHD